MSSARRSPGPLLSFTPSELRTAESTIVFDPKPLPAHPQAAAKHWYHYLPLCCTLLFLFSPHPSLLYVLVDFHLQTLHRPRLFFTHLAVTYTLTFLAVSSLIVILARDPGPANAPPSHLEHNDRDGEDIPLRSALLQDDDFTAPGKWCRKCWAPKAERTHHCSICGRCVLKLDHHCPWLGAKCIGHRTYPAFLHFLITSTLLAAYISAISFHALWYAFNHPFKVHETTPVHELVLAFEGAIFALVLAPFAGYHIYLTSTNQTTLENITPFMLLRHLPALPSSGHSLSDPPLEPELSFQQRRLVRAAHGAVFIYDVGWKKNWQQTFGWKSKYGLLFRLWCGGASPGDGKTFPKNHRAEEMLATLAKELVKADVDANRI